MAITEKNFLELCHPRLYPAMFRARTQKVVRICVQKALVRPVEDLMLGIWQKNLRLGKVVEKAGLPRRSVERHYQTALTLEVDPHSLNNLLIFKNKYQRRSLGNRFIWDGDWDKSIRNFHDSFRYQFMADVWEHRDDLTKSRRYQEMMQMIVEGKPYRSYHKGVYLDNGGKVLRFLEIYLVFMKQLESEGYKSELSPDPMGVALDRNGRLVKINKGLHRLAMAQVVGVKSIPVQVRAVHRVWWDKTSSLQLSRLLALYKTS